MDKKNNSKSLLDKIVSGEVEIPDEETLFRESFSQAAMAFGEKLIEINVKETLSAKGSENSKRRLEKDKDGKQAALRKVHEHWQQWHEDETLYQSKAAFARDMLDAYPELISAKSIEDKCRAWEKQAIKV